jgi:transcriptional regulator with XRE-family HTH domain
MSGLQAAFGKTVRELREELGLSQEKLAQRAKVSRNFWGSVERGESSVSMEVAERFSKALGISFSELVRLSETRRK